MSLTQLRCSFQFPSIVARMKHSINSTMSRYLFQNIFMGPLFSWQNSSYIVNTCLNASFWSNFPYFSVQNVFLISAMQLAKVSWSICEPGCFASLMTGIPTVWLGWTDTIHDEPPLSTLVQIDSYLQAVQMTLVVTKRFSEPAFEFRRPVVWGENSNF